MSPLNLLYKYSRIPDGAFLFGRTYIRRVGAVGVDEWKKQEVRPIAQNQLLDGLTHTLCPLRILCSPCKLVSCWLVRGGKSRKHLGTNKRLPKPVDSMVKAGCPVQVVVEIGSL